MKIDWTHILIALISAIFIVVLALLARGNAQLWSVVTTGAAAWITTVVALLKFSPLQPPANVNANAKIAKTEKS